MKSNSYNGNVRCEKLFETVLNQGCRMKNRNDSLVMFGGIRDQQDVDPVFMVGGDRYHVWPWVFTKSYILNRLTILLYFSAIFESSTVPALTFLLLLFV